MIQHKTKVWLNNSIIGFVVIFNILLIKTAFIDNANLYWLLIASIPLLCFVIFIFRQSNYLLHKNYKNSQQYNAVKSNFKWLSKSGYTKPAIKIDLNISIGNDQCSKPYKASIFNIKSFMNVQNVKSVFNSLTNKKNYDPKNTKQAVLCTYSFGDGLVWQIKPDYAGCCCKNGDFNSETFKRNASLNQIKMVELILSSSNKFKTKFDITFNTSETHSVKNNNSVSQEPSFSTFTEAEGMIHFLNRLRKLSGGKPIGIRVCINDKKEFYQICYAIKKTQFIPDFIVVEESFAKQSITNLKQKSYAPMPLYEALQFVSATLQMYSLKNKIKIIAAGKIVCGLDILKIIALGADSVYSEMDDYKTINNAEKEYPLLKNKTINNFYNKHIADIIKIMQRANFKKISDITLPNLFRSMESFSGSNDPIPYQSAVKNIYVSKLNTSIKNEREKEHIA